MSSQHNKAIWKIFTFLIFNFATTIKSQKLKGAREGDTGSEGWGWGGRAEVRVGGKSEHGL